MSDDRLSVELTETELRIISGAVNWVTGGPNSMSELEFRIVIGADKREGIELIGRINELLRRHFPIDE